jgi:hypothetical protein
MAEAIDPFVGIWKLNPEKSQFGPHHRPRGATLTLKLNPQGYYLMTAEGTNDKGEPVAERPQVLIPDGAPHPIPDFSGLSTICSRPDSRTLRAEARREDGSLVGHGEWTLSADGDSLIATNSGMDSQLREFQQRTHWERSRA